MQMSKQSNERITPRVSDLSDMSAWQPRSGVSAVLRYLYLPVGIILLVLRLFSLFLASLIALVLPRAGKRALYRCLLKAMNIRIKCAMTPQQVGQHTDGCVVALNHISVFDHYPVLAMPFATVMVVKTDSIIGKLTGHLLFQCSGSSYWQVTDDKRQLAGHFRQWQRAPEGTALYITPEATINNGKGLFRFRPEFMVRRRPVVPLAMKLKTPLGLNPNPLEDPGAMKFLRLLAMPWLEFELTFLAHQSPAAEQSDQDFADQVQNAIAQHLQIAATRWTREDKYHDLEQRRLQP